jgi:hypothetical protein
MTREIIAAALEAEGLKASGQGFTIAEEREATFLVSAPGDVLSVGKVVQAELREKFIHLQTSRDERYFFAYEDVLGVRILGKSPAKHGSAGFGR